MSKYSTSFLLDTPLAAIKDILNGAADGEDIGALVSKAFMEHFDNESIKDTIPLSDPLKPVTGKLVKMVAMIQQNSLEPEYFLGKSGHFMVQGDDESDCNGKMFTRKSVMVKPVSRGHIDQSDVIKVYYYDEQFDGHPLNTVLWVYGVWEEDIHGEGLVFHSIFSQKHVPDTKPKSLTELKNIAEQPLGSLLALWSVSRVAERVDGMMGCLLLGSLSLNIYGVQDEAEYSRIIDFVKAVKTHYKIVSAGNEALAVKSFLPELDVESGLLKPSDLQLPSGCALVVDERDLQPGKLDATATANLSALMSICKDQLCPYQFPLHPVMMPCDYPVLVISREKSLLPCTWKVGYSVIASDLDKSLADTFNAARLLDTSMAKEVAEQVEQEYMDLRKQSAKTVDEDRLHALLTTARLHAVLRASGSIALEDWHCALKLI